MAVPYILSQPYLDANFAYLATGLSTGTVATTNATATTILTIPVASGQTVLISALVAGRRTGGSGGTTGDSAGYVLNGAAKNISGTVTIVGQALAFTAEDQGAWTADLAVSGTNIIVRVTGAANNNVNWAARAQTTSVS